MTAYATGSRTAPAEGRRGPDSTATGLWTRLMLLTDLRCAELANALGLSWKLSNIKLVLLLAIGALVLAIPAAAFVFARIFSLVSTEVPPPALLLPLATLLIFISGAGILWAEIMGKYRTAVSGHPNLRFFRALDIPATMVHAVYVVPRLGLAMGFWVLAGLGTIAGLLVSVSSREWLPVALGGLILQPLLWLSAALLASLRLAARKGAVGMGFVTGLAYALAAGVAAGALVSTVLPRITVGDPGGIPAMSVPGQEYGLAAVLLPALVAAALLALCVPSAVRLRGQSFLVAPAGAADVPPRMSRNLAWFWIRTLRYQRRKSWRKMAENRTGWFLGTLIGFLVALRSTGAWDRTGLDAALAPMQTTLVTALALASAVLGIACAEMTLGDLSRRVVGPALRAAIELGAPVRTAAAVHSAALFVPSLILGSLVAGAGFLVLDGAAGVLPLFMAAGACAGTIIAEQLFPPPRNVDGGAGESLATALASLILAAVPALWTMAAPEMSGWMTPLTAAALVGGALWCVRRNLITL